MVIGFFGALINNDNMGCVALTYSLLSLVEDISKETQLNISYYIFEVDPDEEKTLLAAKKLGICPKRIKSFDVRPLFRFRRFIHHFSTGIVSLSALRKCDLCVDITAGDSFTDIYGQYTFDVETNVKLLIERLNIPLILGPQTYGPYENEDNINKAKKAIEGAILVISRDQKSADFIASFSNKEVYVTTDLAFKLPYKKCNQRKGDKVKVGINVSGLLISNKTERTNLSLKLKANYEQYITTLIDWMLDMDCYEIHVIPHVGQDGVEWLKQRYGDQIIYYDAFEDPMSAKYIISGLDVFIGSRMHATIGSFSAGVVTIPVAYSRKFTGLYDSLGYSYVVDLIEENTDEAVQKTIDQIENREQLRHSLQQSMLLVREKSERNYDLLKMIITSVGGQQSK